MKYGRLLAVAASALLFTGCTKMVVGMMVPTIEKLSAVGFSKTDTDFMGTAMPGALLQLEGFLELSPSNYKLLKIVAETKCGYAMGWVEPKDTELASKYYLEGKDLALRGLYAQNKKYAIGLYTGYVCGYASL